MNLAFIQPYFWNQVCIASPGWPLPYNPLASDCWVQRLWVDNMLISTVAFTFQNQLHNRKCDIMLSLSLCRVWCKEDSRALTLPSALPVLVSHMTRPLENYTAHCRALGWQQQCRQHWEDNGIHVTVSCVPQNFCHCRREALGNRRWTQTKFVGMHGIWRNKEWLKDCLGVKDRCAG